MNYILIDDDVLIQKFWKRYFAFKPHCQFEAVSSYKELLDYIESKKLNPSFTTIFVDYDLEDEDGLRLITKIFHLGFENLYLSTGYPPQHFDDFDLRYTKGVMSKKPQDFFNASFSQLAPALNTAIH